MGLHQGAPKFKFGPWRDRREDDTKTACRACRGKGMLLFPTSSGDDVDWDICQRCGGAGSE